MNGFFGQALIYKESVLKRIGQWHTAVLDSMIPAKLRIGGDLMRCRILVGIILYVTLAALAMSVVRFLTDGLIPSTLVSIIGVILFTLIWAVFWFSHLRTLAGDLLVLAALAIIVMIALNDNGLYSRVIFWMPAIPLLGNFLAGHFRALGATLLSWLVLIALYIAHLQGWVLSVVGHDPLPGRLAAALASVLFVAGVSAVYESSHRLAEEERRRFNKVRSNWVSVVSHELRTPLTAIQGSLGLLLGRNRSELKPDAEQMMDIAYQNCQRLVRLVNDVLDIEKIERGEMELNLQPVDLAKLIREAVQLETSVAQLSEVSLENKVAQEKLFIIADGDRLVQVLQNLISNAIKFSPKGATVRLEAEMDHDLVTVKVVDAGSGIPPEFEEQLFTRFTQSEDSNVRQHGGSGLGLHICKSIIEKHQGKIGFSRNLNRGVTFYFILPVKA